jgi:RND family efflux transporter MFP subunit
MSVASHSERRFGTVAVAASVALLLAGCGRGADEEVESQAVAPVRVAAATSGSIRGFVHATGVVTPAPGAELVVVAPEAARVAELPHAEGDRVRRGELLARFDIPGAAAEARRAVAEVQRAEAQLANARARAQRASALFDRGIAARQEVEDADRDVADAIAAVAQAESGSTAADAIAERAVVRAPFDGFIAKRHHNPGDLVEASAADPVLRVVDLQRLEVMASVPLADASRIRIGAPARLTAGGGAMSDLRVVSRPAAVEAVSATVPVRLAFVEPAESPVGAPVEVEIQSEEHAGAVLVPVAALVREGEETAVFVVDGNRARRRAVEIGLMDGERVEILSGLEAGATVIVDGQAGLPDGAETTVVEEAGGGSTPTAAVAAEDRE